MNKGNKVLLVIHTPPPYGGGEVQAQNLKNYFSEKENYYIYDYSDEKKNRKDWNSLKIKVLLKGIFWILKVSYLIIRINPDIIYFTLPKSFTAFLRNASIIPLAKFWRVKIYGELPGTSFRFMEKRGTLKYKIGRFFLKRINEIRFLSPRIEKDHITYHNLTNARVIPNGIEFPPNFKVNSSVFKRKILPLIYIGSLELSKGLFNSIQTIRLCKKDNLDVHFNLVGEWCYESEKRKILEYIKKYNLEKYITFHGKLTGKEKWKVFSSCAVQVHPTFWDGVPLTILEAMALGLAVISTNVGGIPDTIANNKNGIILEKNTPEQLFNAIKQFYANRKFIESISKNNINDFKEKYDLSIFIKNMDDWFQGKLISDGK